MRGDDVRVVQTGRRTDFALEPFQRIVPIEQHVVDDLQHLEPVHQPIANEIHDPHPASAEFFEQFEVGMAGQLDGNAPIG